MSSRMTATPVLWCSECCGARGKLERPDVVAVIGQLVQAWRSRGETIYLASDNLAFIVLLKDHFIRRSLISTEQKTRITGGRPNMGMRITMETFDGRNRCFDISAQRSNECVRLIRKLRWIGMDDEADRVSTQLSGWPFRPTETVIAGPWATD